MKRHSTRLFTPYKALGDVCSAVPPVFRILPTERRFTSMICAIDNVVVQYSCERLRLISISDALPSCVNAIAADKRHVFAACESHIAVLHLSRQVKHWLKIDAHVHSMIPFGDILLVVDVYGALHVLDIFGDQELVLIESPENFTFTTIVHPATYLNKVLLGSKQGTMRLLNFKTGQLVHEFGKAFTSSINVLEQSTAIDIIAAGLECGHIVLHNIRLDATLAIYKYDSPVSSISFRSDGVEIMSTAFKNGSFAVWDLNKKALIGQVHDAHNGSISRVYFLTGEPLMVSAGSDNTLKTWIYDMGNKMPRQLILLEGHYKPLTTARFLNSDMVLSSSLDGSLRCFSIVRDTQRQKLGNAGIMSRSKAKRKKRDIESIELEPIIQVQIGHNREAAWDNVLCRHSQTAVVTSWTTRRQTLGAHRLLHKRFLTVPSLAKAVASFICISSCGNFGIVGYTSGHIDCFNLQSGQHRKTFSLGKTDERAHDCAVHGLVLDPLNKQLISAGIDGKLRFWNFRNAKLLAQLTVPSPVEQFFLNHDNALLAIGVGTGSIGIVDTLCRKVVRIIKNAHTSQITAVEFSPDGNWLVSAERCGLIKVWDIVTNCLIDVMKCDSFCISLSFSPSGEYLATCHDGQRSVYLWANKCLFSTVSNLKALPIDYTPNVAVCLPTYRIGYNESDGQKISDEVVEDVESESKEVKQIGDLLTLSGLAPSRWANLPYLDVIHERNKPVEPAKKPKAAPFFLPTTSTLTGFEFEKLPEDDNEQRKVLMAKRNALEIQSSFACTLLDASNDEDFDSAFNSLKWMSLATTDFQLRILTKKAFPNFLRMLLKVLKSGCDFELVQSYLATFLKLHRNDLWDCNDDDQELNDVLLELRKQLSDGWDQLDSLLQWNSSILQWIKSALS